MKSPFRDRLLLVAFLIILLVFGGLLARKIIISRKSPVPPPPVQTQEAPKQLREVTLYFGGPDASRLVAEAREIACLGEADCLREVVQALINGPVGDLTAVVPTTAAIRDVTIDDATAVLNFSRALVADHPGGSASELLTVYGIANTVAVNFPHLRQVRFLVEGEPVESLRGHMGLNAPVQADFRFSRPPEDSDGLAEPSAEMEGTSEKEQAR